jgi:two-component system cell cycle sensor histidine kinase/response regulator CckA
MTRKKTKQQLLAEITELKALLNSTSAIEAELRESKRRLADIIDFLPDATFAIDLEGRVIFWNRAIEQMTGIAAVDILGKGNYEYSLPFYGVRRPILIDLVFASNEEIRTRYHFVQQKGSVLLAEANVAVRNGEIRHLWGKASPLCDNDGRTVGAIEAIRDITDQRLAEKEHIKLEETLQRAEKMEALGTLAGGVAHDLNNMLGVIVGYAELLLHSTDMSKPVKDRLANILKSGERAAAIVQDLLTLARRGVYAKEVMNINQTIQELLSSPEFIKLSSYNPYVKVTTHLDPQICNIFGSPIHFLKSLFNLVCNGFEAMPDGGELNIKTGNQYLDSPLAGYDKIVPGTYVVISISDTGHGISEEDIKHVFEPFYTKKVMGKSGTGLGLAVVWGSVEDHHGYITVKSDKNKGSIFKLYIPITEVPQKKQLHKTNIADFIGNRETILIVDDVKEQRELAAEMLRTLQYTVYHVGSGEECIEYLKNNDADLVILDMIMDPGMDGLDTYREIRKCHPGQKAIIVSGFAETERVTKAQALGAGRYIKKPYRQEQLALAVRQELNRK